MIVLGLTGSIGMGKSTAANMLRRLGVPLFDADAVVHRLLAPGGAAVRQVEAAFPGVRNEAGGVDRQRLGQRVFGQPEALRRLEGILPALESSHALVEAFKLAPTMAKDQTIIVNLSGRGDKDCQEVARLIGT